MKIPENHRTHYIALSRPSSLFGSCCLKKENVRANYQEAKFVVDSRRVGVKHHAFRRATTLQHTSSVWSATGSLM